MKKRVLITIKDEQFADGRKDGTETVLKGYLLYGLNNSYIISYDEYKEEFNGCHVTITVRDDKTVSIVRKGGYNAELFIEKGNLKLCDYGTPYGKFTVGISGEDVKSTVNTEKATGRLKVSYGVDFGGNYRSQNRLEIILSPIE